MKNWSRLVLANVLVALLMLALVEFSTRIVWTAKACWRGACDFSSLRAFTIADPEISRNYGFSRFDGSLGHVPNEGFDAVIDIPGWKNSKITIDSRGFRSNDNPATIGTSHRTLTLGDSFTFGSQVSNAETWAACLERKTAAHVDNAGVFGYGSAQAIKRGSAIIEQSRAQPYARVILSVLVAGDFARDRLAYNYGFPRPAVVKTQAGLAWAEIPDPKVPGTRYNPRKPNALMLALYQRSLLANRILTRAGFDPYGDLLSREHPAAAGKEEIIDWAFEKFSRLDVPEKFVVLQYYADLTAKELLEERAVLLRILAKYSIPYVDTYAALAGKDPARHWNKHHTPLGNELVCDTILARINPARSTPKGR